MLYISFYIFAFLLNFISTFANYAPSARYGHTSVLVDNKLYFHGGHGVNIDYTADFFYLDVSRNFTMTTLPWNELPFPENPRNAEASACRGGYYDNSIFIFGGMAPGNPFISKFDISNQQWINITSGGIIPVGRYSFSCANFNHRSIAIFAGYNHDNTSDLLIFDSFVFTWSLSNAPDAPSQIHGYCAISLPDETILYLGGQYVSNSELVPMGFLSLYDPVSSTWKSLSTSGSTPPGRIDFSAVLTSDGRIIIFGGSTLHATLGDLWILDTEKYQWSAGNIVNPNGLAIYGHTATLVNDYMIVAFGAYNVESLPQNYSSTINMLDVRQGDSYEWVTEFTTHKK